MNNLVSFRPDEPENHIEDVIDSHGSHVRCSFLGKLTKPSIHTYLENEN